MMVVLCGLVVIMMWLHSIALHFELWCLRLSFTYYQVSLPSVQTTLLPFVEFIHGFRNEAFFPIVIDSLESAGFIWEYFKV